MEEDGELEQQSQMFVECYEQSLPSSLLPLQKVPHSTDYLNSSCLDDLIHGRALYTCVNIHLGLVGSLVRDCPL